ncbi:MAG: glutamine--tRNA ligase/YqeY domain fusion protein [Gammaproteobacteria bacterium]
MSTKSEQSSNFIRNIINQDITDNKYNGKVVTRFPPEPNGYLHIGHAKSICLNFGVANAFNGECNLRFDDTNPEKESQEYIDAIKNDVQWLGFKWSSLRHASDYFEKLYDYAIELIKLNKAYVCSLDADEIRTQRGTLTKPGIESPFRNRSIEENLQIFADMRDGKFKEGEHVLRAKIDMASGNINMRDPVLYRIKFATHPKTQDKWCIYPMYDYTHCLSDAIEGVTHSLCTLEFEDHRPLYDWVLDVLKTDCHPKQIEFARLSLEYTLSSKRKLNQLVTDNHVTGWNDPRMPTLSGMRRRGIPPEAIRTFCDRIGITKKDSFIEMGVLENCIREELDPNTNRIMCAVDPLKVVIENYPDDKEEAFTVNNHPKKPDQGKRSVPFSKTLYIERDDFMEEPAKKFFRLSPGSEVRLRNAYDIKCVDVIKNDAGKITELRCEYDPDSAGKNKKKLKGIIHWVSAKHAVTVETRLYDRLFTVTNPAAENDLASTLNNKSLLTHNASKIEPHVKNISLEDRVQFERQGYFCLDSIDSSDEKLIFNRISTLRDTWANS